MSPAMKPEVGMGVSVYHWTDVEPGTIIRVSTSGRQIWFRKDSATLLNGVGSGEPDALTFTPGGFVGHTSGQQRWSITPCEAGHEYSATLRADGTWRLVGSKTRVKINERVKYRDFNF